MKHPFKDFFYFSRGERHGILVLIIGIAAVFLSGYIYSYLREQQSFTGEDKVQQAIAIKEYETFANSIEEQEKEWEKQYPKYSSKGAQNVFLTSFNPNTADSSTFRRLGLPGWMARNILHYREKGGKFRKADDFRKIYGLTDEQYQALLPYISIEQQDTVIFTAGLYHPPTPDSTAYNIREVIYKYPAGTIINLNRADTTELKKIPGIGSGIARMIANYRQRLGGFYSIEQLQEIHIDYRQLQSWFHINFKDICLINLNNIGIERLHNHPYINFYQAKAFSEYRKKKGVIKSLKPFALYEEFTEADLERISHYICFE